MQNVETDTQEKKEERRRGWYFEETGEVRKPQKGELFLFDDSLPERALEDFIGEPFPILKLTEYPSNPLTPIMRVWEKYKDRGEQIVVVTPIALVTDLWTAINKSMAIMEGKP